MTRLTRKLSDDARRIMLPLLLVSMLAVTIYLVLRDVREWRMEELGGSVIFDVVMIFVVLGAVSFFGLVGCLAQRGEDAKADKTEGYCFFGAMIGAVVFFLAILN
ncbi:hypothetical protein SAMN05414139_02773 [Burkholderia sp. D7]|nr:hypothetical protein SAMN05414139_02773 [Burkholderia sp. D7]